MFYRIIKAKRMWMRKDEDKSVKRNKAKLVRFQQKMLKLLLILDKT